MNIEQAIEVERVKKSNYVAVLERYMFGDIHEHSMSEWCHNIANWADTKGWNDKVRSIDEWIALLHTEISEAYEEFRNGHKPDEVYFELDKQGIPKPEGIFVEVADELIRIFHFAAFYGINLNELVNLKMGYNATRPYRHGGKRS